MTLTTPDQMQGDFLKLLDDPFSFEYVQRHKPLLSHYTSIERAESILRTGELWFSNPLLLNDHEEIRFGTSEGARIFHSLRDICPSFCKGDIWEKIHAAFSSRLRRLGHSEAADIYVSCFSEHAKHNTDGVLSMWRGYGARGRGVALIFDTAPLGGPDADHPIALCKVKYGTREQRRQRITEKLCDWASICRSFPMDEDAVEIAAETAFKILLFLSLSWKHDGYREEAEWRAIYLAETDSSALLHKFLSYSTSASSISPIFKFKVEPLTPSSHQRVTMTDLLHSIVLGPAISSDLAVVGTRRMLRELGREHLCDRVAASRIPFREY